MTDRAFNYKLYFSDLKKLEREKRHAFDRWKGYEVTIGVSVISYEFRGKSDRSTPIEGKLMKCEKLRERFIELEKDYLKEDRERLNIINQVPSSELRAILIDRYLLMKSADATGKEMGLCLRSIERKTNEAFEILAQINPLKLE